MFFRGLFGHFLIVSAFKMSAAAPTSTNPDKKTPPTVGEIIKKAAARAGKYSIN